MESTTKVNLANFFKVHIWSRQRRQSYRRYMKKPIKGYERARRLRRRADEERGSHPTLLDDLIEGSTLAALADEYLKYQRTLNRTPRAIENLAGTIKPFLVWAQERSLFEPARITRSMIESYQRWLWAYRKANGKPLGIMSQRARISIVRKFFAWLCRCYVLEANPASEIELPKPGKRLPTEALSISEVETVLSQPDIADPLGIRDRAILELFYSTGIRRAEMAHLAAADLNREKHVLRVRQGKGSKDRVVPVGRRAMHWVEKYLEEVRPLLLVRADEQGLFLTGYGAPFNTSALGCKVAGYITQAAIGRKAGPHLLRHTCATHLLEGGADIRYIQQLLGHENLETTAIYTEVSISQLQAVHARCHPAERVSHSS